MKVVNIKWDTDGDARLAKELPSKIEIPDCIFDEDDDIGEVISDYISDLTGFCHFGFDLVEQFFESEEQKWEMQMQMYQK